MDAKLQMHRYLLLLWSIPESITRVEDAQIVDILHITFSEAKRYGMLLSEEMQSIKCFGLSFSYGRHVRGSRQAPIPRESPSCVLDNQPLRSGLSSGLIVKQRSKCILFAPTAKAITRVSKGIFKHALLCRS